MKPFYKKPFKKPEENKYGLKESKKDYGI